MKIVINPFDRKSIAAAERLVKQYKKDFLVKEQEFVRRLAEIGVRVASAGFSMADYDGVNDVVVSLEKTRDGYNVVASGKTVGFLEFGVGRPDRNPEYNSSEIDYTPPPRGSYGKRQGLNPHGWWFVSGEGARATHSYGNPPACAMLTARDVVIEQVTKIAREVFNG